MADEIIGERDAFEAWWRDWQRGTWDASIDREMPAHWNEDSRSRMKLAFQAGRASLAASAGSEPNGYQKALDIRIQEGGWELSGSKVPVLYTDSINGRQVCRDDVWLCTTEAFAQPSPPEGMAGWRQGVEAVAAMLTKKADDFAKEHGHDDMGGLSFGRGAHADAKLDYHSGLLELADEVREMRSEATPELSSDNRVLMEHSGCGRGTQIDTLTVRLNPGDKVILCPGPVTRASITAPPLPASEAKEL